MIIENPTEQQLNTLTMIVYCITNKINNKKYIGKSKTPFNIRYSGRKWWIKTDNQHLKRAAKKYGVENFSITILEHSIKNNKKLRKLERNHIIKLRTIHPNGYNFILGTYKAKERHRSCRNYKVRNPDGKIIMFNNLRQFCRKNGLCENQLQNVLKKKYRYRSCRGWTHPDTKIEDRQVISPEGKIYSVRWGKISEFCRQHGLINSPFSAVLLGKRKSHGGWKLFK